jgi:hypothetical protein
MKCLDEEKLLMYQNNLLESEEAASLREHLRHCHECRNLVAAEAQFKTAIRNAVSLEKLSLEPIRRKGFLSKFAAVAGGLISISAIFNAIVCIGLVLYLSDFSLARIIIGLKNTAEILIQVFTYYSVWLGAASLTIYAGATCALIFILFGKKLALKTVKI